MTSPPTRRPLPALIFLVALTLLTALVWWRVLNRHGSTPASAASTPTCQSSSPHPSPSVVAVVPLPASVQVQVLNSTQRTGIAGAAQGVLKTDGFVTPTQAVNDTGPQIAGVAEIRYTAAELPAATLLSYYFPGAKLVPLATAPTPDVVVVSLGATYKAVATAAAVKAALAAAHKTQASATSPHPSTPAATHTSTPPATTRSTPAATKSC